MHTIYILISVLAMAYITLLSAAEMSIGYDNINKENREFFISLQKLLIISGASYSITEIILILISFMKYDIRITIKYLLFAFFALQIIPQILFTIGIYNFFSDYSNTKQLDMKIIMLISTTTRLIIWCFMIIYMCCCGLYSKNMYEYEII